MKDKVFHIAAAIAAAMLMSASTPDQRFAGKDGREIAAVIATEYRPQKYAANYDEKVAVAAAYARTADGMYRDYFSTKPATHMYKLSLQHVAPAGWWARYGSPADDDMHNIVPGNPEATEVRGELPPGHVASADYDNGYWRAGTGTISGMETGFYEPADELKGDFARIFMYMGVVYSRELWPGRSTMLYTDGGYPYLTGYGREVLLDWHRSDPVDEAELLRDREIAAFQGCGNPFVADADLAEYIWGAHSGETYPGDEEPKTDPVEDPDTGTLKGVYSLSADSRIDLRSPYVGADANWSIDGVAVAGLSISLDGVSTGRHELSYRSRSAAGKIIITVTP